MAKKAKPEIAIIGAGVVGTAIGVLAARAGYTVRAVASRRNASANRAAKLIGPPAEVCSPREALGRGQIVLITVPDDSIAAVAVHLAETGVLQPKAVIVHCSGALDSTILSPLAERHGAAVASMHPLQTFPNVQIALASLAGCYCFCEGDHRAMSRVMQLAADIGCVPVEIEADRKALYHASACIACNYLATLQEAAIAAAVLAGIGRVPARRALAPLVAATVNNINTLGPGKALTGPIARGDSQTVLRHITALRATDPQLADLYCQLGLRTVTLALQAGKISPGQANRLRQVLSTK